MCGAPLGSVNTRREISTGPSFDSGKGTGPALPPRFKVRQKLGEGALGSSRRVIDDIDGKERVLKVFDSRLFWEFSGRASALEVLQSSRCVLEPGLIPCQECGTFGENLYLLRDFFPGDDFVVWALTRTRTGYRDPWSYILEGIGEILNALAVLHRRQIHGNLKPENLLVEQGPEKLAVRLVDWELPPVLQPMAFYEAQHRRGAGRFLCPEFLSRDCSQDPRRDIFALGVVLRETCLGLEEDTGVGGPNALPGVPQGLKVVIQKATASWHDRYPSAATMLEDLAQEVGAGFPGRAKKISPALDSPGSGCPSAASTTPRGKWPGAAQTQPLRQDLPWVFSEEAKEPEVSLKRLFLWMGLLALLALLGFLVWAFVLPWMSGPPPDETGENTQVLMQAALRAEVLSALEKPDLRSASLLLYELERQGAPADVTSSLRNQIKEMAGDSQWQDIKAANPVVPSPLLNPPLPPPPPPPAQDWARQRVEQFQQQFDQALSRRALDEAGTVLGSLRKFMNPDDPGLLDREERLRTAIREQRSGRER